MEADIDHDCHSPSYHYHRCKTVVRWNTVSRLLISQGICVGFSQKIENEVLDIYGKAGQLAEEVFSTTRTVHSFWLHGLLARKYDTFLADAMRVGFKQSPIYAVLFSTEFFCIYCGYALAFWRGIRMYASGEISESGDVITVIFAVIVAATSLTTIAPNIIVLTKAASAAETLFKTIDRVSEIDPLSEQGEVPSTCEGRISIENVNFAYPTRQDTPVLQDFSLSIPANSTTALVGQSGSGKSTIVGLLGKHSPSYHDEKRISSKSCRNTQFASDTVP